MESHGDEESNFSDVVENLMNMFGNVMSKDVISAVVESCDGDLNVSVDAIMNMASDGNVILKEEDQPPPTTPTENVSPIQTTQAIQSSTSYASSAAQPAQNTGAIPKQIQKPVQHSLNIWTNQIREILYYHGQGSRTLILMRGVPGSGKTYLAKKIIEMTVGPATLNYKTHILSSDDYFMVRGQYQYEKYKLPEAHTWNQNRCREAAKLGYSPIIIDNTNIEVWEMEPYLREGVKNGYIIQVVEPTTPWARKANQLVKRNSHNVPLFSIKRMLDNYQDGVTGDTLIRSYGLSYPAGMVPPVKRNVPPIPEEDSLSSKPDVVVREHTDTNTTAIVAQNATDIQFFRSSTSTVNVQIPQKLAIGKPEQKKNEENTQMENKEAGKSADFFLFLNDDDLTDEERARQKLLLEAQKKLEEIEKVEIEWENGDSWDKDEQGATTSVKRVRKATVASEISTSAAPVSPVTDAKQQRKSINAAPPPSTSFESAKSLMKTVNECQDWSKISMFLSPWVDSPDPSISVSNLEVPVETNSIGTCMEIGDTNVCGKNKVITATPRDINEFHISFNREKIPQKRMLDKSSMTYEGVITEAFRCSNEEKHFIAFRKLFKNIARSDLRDIFDKCCGDVNWSVEIVLDGMNNNLFKTVDTEDLSDQEEEESMEQCACLAKYNIIPDVAPSGVTSSDVVKTTQKDDTTSVTTSGVPTQKKKRDVTMSDETIQIKRQIEQNVVISDNHYSKHCLKIRRFRRGEPDLEENNFEEQGARGLSAEAPPFEPNCISDISDEEDSSNDSDTIVTINLGSTFISELDEKFGRKDMQYPAYIVPMISLPLSALNEINAIWMESLTYQVDVHAKQTAVMMQQDEEFARQIAMKEAELSLAGKEPEIPDFKEIMDMDMALAIYQKDVAEWKNNMPTDMAAKMTRDKLYNLFPDVDKDTLTELLMAHDNNFNSTVEVLLMSTGRDDILEEENGINKFVMAEEMKAKDKILQEQRKELSETEWPLLSKDHKVDMSTVEAFREEADKHLARRNLNFQKAQDCVRRGMTQVANYYSEIANFHKQKYEHANGLAVASLMQFHALNNPDCTTIDLHYLRVKEAKESLDIFIDTHISKLRESGNRRKQTLFFITGRGSHSQGRARIKPATIQRLKERGLGYFLKNPGLLAAKVNMDNKLTYQITAPSG